MLCYVTVLSSHPPQVKDKHGREVLSLVRARHVEVVKNQCMAMVISLFPLPPSRHHRALPPTKRMREVVDEAVPPTATASSNGMMVDEQQPAMYPAPAPPTTTAMMMNVEQEEKEEEDVALLQPPLSPESFPGWDNFDFILEPFDIIEDADIIPLPHSPQKGGNSPAVPQELGQPSYSHS